MNLYTTRGAGVTGLTGLWGSKLIRIGISMGLLIWLLWRFDLRGVWGYFEDLRISVWATAFLMLLIAHVLSSIRWWILANTLSVPGSWPTYSGNQV